ncbi:glycosyltransferase [Microbulbifer elongatus]|uniref:glycosyltransferase n=1 Tax=Microbulbifer elongatus TaxID=86173 RepID=UPI001CFDB579|nr:glycosyltransferase [Microbulbifer elongatus]
MNDNHKCNILVMTSTLPRWKDDPTPSFVLDFCKHLKSANLSIKILAPHYINSRIRERVDGVDIQRFRYWPVESGQNITYVKSATQLIRLRPLYAAKLLAFLASLFIHTLTIAKRQKPILINAHWIIPQGFIAVLVGKLLKIPVVVTVHGGDIFGLQGKLFKAIKRWTLENATSVVVNSSATERSVQQISERISTEKIPMGIAVYTVSEDEAQSETGNQDQFTVLFAGRVSDEKGVIFLCEAFLLLKRRTTNTTRKIKLIIAGSGPAEEEVRKFITENDLEDSIELKGWLSHPELHTLYRYADVLVGPSITLENGWQEAFGLVFAECLSTGTPVIATRTGGISDIVEDSVSGFLVPERDPAAICEKLLYLLSNPQKASEMGKRGKEHVEKNFLWNGIVSKYKNVFSRAIN